MLSFGSALVFITCDDYYEVGKWRTQNEANKILGPNANPQALSCARLHDRDPNLEPLARICFALSPHLCNCHDNVSATPYWLTLAAPWAN
jgi:hypothetical protein